MKYSIQLNYRSKCGEDGIRTHNYNVQDCCFSEVTLRLTTIAREYFAESEVVKLPRRIIINSLLNLFALPKGFEPLSAVLETVMLPLHQGSKFFCDPGWIRTSDFLIKSEKL